MSNQQRKPLTLVTKNLSKGEYGWCVPKKNTLGVYIKYPDDFKLIENLNYPYSAWAFNSATNQWEQSGWQR